VPAGDGGVTAERAQPTVLIENERVRVTRWHFAPGASTGWHRHEHY
jgi:quercetin dioxygenase-like cupin family protein